METKNIVVVGGGAAGFFCAIQIAEMHPDWHITIVEKSSKLLSKVRVSGGGRCNVTHACPEVDHLIQKYPKPVSPCVPMGVPYETGFANTNVMCDFIRQTNRKK